MKGAIADPWLNTINIPKRARTIIIGISQYFFLLLRNSINSLIKFNTDPFFYFICYLYNKNCLINRNK
jgi:hypothetical protein